MFIAERVHRMFQLLHLDPFLDSFLYFSYFDALITRCAIFKTEKQINRKHSQFHHQRFLSFLKKPFA